MNEAETIANLIDPHLRSQGWHSNGSLIKREFPITPGRILGLGRRGTPEKADIVLQYNNRNIAVIEAKRNEAYVSDGRDQAIRYATRLNVRYTFSTNGDSYYQIDLLTQEETEIFTFPTPDELWEMTFPNAGNTPQQITSQELKENLLSIPFQDKGGTWKLRYYQENAITKVIEAVADGQKRILLTLATGTGKTAIAFQIAWKLFEGKWNLSNNQRRPRILFLADRNILADQAYNAFSSFDEDALVRIKPADIRKKGQVPKNGSVFFTIFQTFLSGDNGTPYFGEYPKDFFDFIVIDECHRGGANDESNWRVIMDYFSPAVQLGLTATPKRDQNVDTYKYFGEPVYIYSLKEGINDGFLTPFKVKQISTTIDNYTFTKDDLVLAGEIDESREYTKDEMNRMIQIKEREEYMVKVFMDLINQNEKTLVFCATQTHAAMVRDFINKHVKVKNVNYCQRVTADDGDSGESNLRAFQDNEKTIPTILTTSQKLSTGVDAPEVRNIILMRKVNSMIEFKQIVGRGTRLSEGKDYFTIYDFYESYKHFNDPEWDGEPLEPETTEPGTPPQPCVTCGKRPCECTMVNPGDPCEICGYTKCRCNSKPKEMVKVRLSDGKIRELQNMVKTTFWSPDGRQIDAKEYLELLFGTLPDLFKSEEQLRQLWSLPDTRKKLLLQLEERGFSRQQLVDFQQVLNAEDADLFDVLAYVAFESKIIDRGIRAEYARETISSLTDKQQEFINFVLNQYVKEGVDELDIDKLSELLELKYLQIADAKKELGSIAEIRESFINFQPYLYNRSSFRV
jgi:type I restriction enzyme R subunit